MIRIVLMFVTSSVLTACIGAPRLPTPAPESRPAPAPASPSTAKTNPYEVFGQRYYPVTDATGYRERGVASWYGGKFHGRKTANGERYDMYRYTAAHTTLPLPTWVKVTNLRNGSTVTVRVNDRGPFVKNRLIDLSYAAARQLDMIDDGTTLVEVEALAVATGHGTSAVRPPIPAPLIASAAPPPVNEVTTDPDPSTADATDAGNAAVYTGPAPTPPATPPMATPALTTSLPATPLPATPPLTTPPAVIYVQVGAFGDRGNAERLQNTLYNAGIGQVRLDRTDLAGIPVHRVQIGPVSSVPDYDVLITQLESIGINDTHLVTE